MKSRKILTETCEEAGVYNNEIVEEAEAKSLKELKKRALRCRKSAMKKKMNGKRHPNLLQKCRKEIRLDT